MARMPRNSDGSPRSAEPETLAEMLFYLSDPSKRRELESFRIKFEAVHGPTDLTKRYTSTWPTQQQTWLIDRDVRRYFDGLPSFVKAYLRGKMQLAAQSGQLDDMPDNLLTLFVSGRMKLDHEVRGI